MHDLPLEPAHEQLIDESIWHTGKMIADTLANPHLWIALRRLKCTDTTSQKPPNVSNVRVGSSATRSSQQQIRQCQLCADSGQIPQRSEMTRRADIVAEVV